MFGLSSEVGAGAGFQSHPRVGGLEASGFCLPEMGRELKRAM